jgi:Tfp pilus assembly protein PilO
MFGIPQWAIGVVAIMAVIGVVQIAWARLMPPGYRHRSWKGWRGRGDEPSVELEEMQAKLAELEELKHRVGELEERVDFTERLLARQREGERLKP